MKQRKSRAGAERRKFEQDVNDFTANRMPEFPHLEKATVHRQRVAIDVAELKRKNPFLTMKILVVLILYLLIIPRAMAVDLSKVFTQENIAVTVSTAALMADWATTRNAAKDDWKGRKEHNRYLGEDPPVAQVDTYFGLVSVIHIGSNYLIRKYLRGPRRKFWIWLENSAVAGVHGPEAYNNYRLGLSYRF